MFGDIKSINVGKRKSGAELSTRVDVKVKQRPLTGPQTQIDTVVNSLHRFYQEKYKGRVEKGEKIPDDYSYSDDGLAQMCRIYNNRGVGRGNIRITPRLSGQDIDFYQRLWADFRIEDEYGAFSRQLSEKHCKQYISYVKDRKI